MNCTSNAHEKKAISAQKICWIHLNDLRFFLFLGANPHEKKIGQNIIIHFSFSMNYENTEDKLENTLDYGLLIQNIENSVKENMYCQLLEYLCEQILNNVGKEFNIIHCARIKIQKGYVPLQNFTGSVTIEAEKIFKL